METKKVYFIGIGGIGMSSLARWYNKKGYLVSGYDKTETTLTKELEKEGISITYNDSIDSIDSYFVSDVAQQDTLIVYTPAIPKDNLILNYFKDKGYYLHKRAEVLGLLSKSHFCIAVAGTHGKTTTSTLIAHILTHSGYGCTAFLGGISSNYNTNLLLSDNDIVVLEADEFDRSFLHLQPNIAIITSTDADHLDIYGDANSVKESFNEFANKIVDDGKLIKCAGLPINRDGISYSVSDVNAEVRASNVYIENGEYHFDWICGSKQITNLRLGIQGLHNVENAIAAIKVATLLGISEQKIRAALIEFKGVKRRFEYVLKKDNITYIDDYAHHPTEIKACLGSVLQLFPSKKITVIFQPHLFSRTNDFYQDFAKELSVVDNVILLPIYPAREKPMAGVSSEMILNLIKSNQKIICAKEYILTMLKDINMDVLVTMGAGDIDTLVDPIKKYLDDTL